MENFNIKKYNPSHKKLWDSFVKEAKNATFLFQRDFMDYHSDRFTDHSLLVFKGEKLVAVLPANISGSELHSHQGLSYGGLVLSKKCTFPETLAIFKNVLAFLNREGVAVLKLKLIPKIYHQLPSDEIDYLLFLTQASLTRRDITSCVNNENSLKIKSSNRLRGIKKGVKNELEVKEEAKFKAYWNEVLEPNLMQVHNQKPVHSSAEIELLQSRFPENIKQFNVYKDDEIVAGATIFETSNVAHAQYISANEMGRQTGGLDFLFNHLLEHFSHKKYFDFGIVNEAQGLKVNKGLLHWKETFGGRSITHDFYEVKTENHKLLNDIFI
ncbi:GNAT family N-acetyltransferase [Aequorivita marisscotiae]|uniref:GNAT family N-acetyltransferase n=1 Tax=Aequorivita marisscotiae TaxID=3040348 RepID=A0ABY8KRX1_9FLAO|nr:GNAT family N-acetyltransferase [Aequorivita sp. Ant34-E75]WGF91284.1 GNAT family N-acetyltransferase [Aequorivita sp. Ant34-E75]